MRSNGIDKLTETVALSVLARPPLEFQVHLFPEDKKKKKKRKEKYILNKVLNKEGAQSPILEK